MRDEKRPQAERLFDAIGMIDDRIITEAQMPYATQSRATGRKQFRALIALACAFAVITVGVFGNALLSGLLGTGSSDQEDNMAPDASAPIQSVSLDQLLAHASESGTVSRVSSEDIDFFDGNVKILWRASGDHDDCWIRVASHDQIHRIQELLKYQADTVPPEHSDPLSYDVWIAYGDGTVVSPYLKNSPGNVGYAELFTYAPEVEPSPGFVRLIDELIPRS